MGESDKPIFILRPVRVLNGDILGDMYVYGVPRYRYRKWEAVTSRQCFRLSMHGLSYIVLLRSAPPLRLLLVRGV